MAASEGNRRGAGGGQGPTPHPHAQRPAPPAHPAKRLASLGGAAEVFVRRGFAAGTTKEIAAEVGLSQPAIYHYVGSKHDLLREIALHVDEEMNGALARGLAVSEEPGRQLRGIIHEFTAAVVRD